MIACSPIEIRAEQPRISLHFNEDEVCSALAKFEPEGLMAYHESENWKKDMGRLKLSADHTATFDLFEHVVKLNNSYASVPNGIGIYYSEKNLEGFFQENRMHKGSIHAIGGNPWRETLGDFNLFRAFHDEGVFQERLVELDLTHAQLVKSSYQVLASMQNLRKLAMPLRSACLYDDELVLPASIEELVIHNARIDEKLGRKLKGLKNLKKLTLVSCYFDLPKLPDSVKWLQPLKSSAGEPHQDGGMLPEYDPLGSVRPNVKELVLIKGFTGAIPFNYVWDKLESITTDYWIPLDYFWFDAPHMSEPSFPGLKHANFYLGESSKKEALNAVLRWSRSRSGKDLPIITVK